LSEIQAGSFLQDERFSYRGKKPTIGKAPCRNRKIEFGVSALVLISMKAEKNTPNLFKATLIVAFCLLMSGFVNSQTWEPAGGYGKRYRVTAYKISGFTTLTSLSNIAEAIPKPTLYIPSAFTPNGDGINDKFGVKAQGIKYFKMEIYNRWGELIFESENLDQLWDGTYEGKAITSTDVFVYQVKAIGKNNEPLPDERGTVTLIADGAGD